MHIGDESECVRIAAGMRAAGFHVDAILFPAIGPGQSRLRFILNAHHTKEQIDGVIETLARFTSG
jgi:7-keto-8-aminopelargonate synthetase-like enzyme